ncbi:MAG: glyoxylate/hydroxypyruvate reductase A [Devosia sp.]|uniref:2-hydroxyacid dehydrogenase n=1 Tax=Devosia sp. TaxID=1871048 RepID=UPI001AD418E4|nr:glyoxylate/hydroxypyruvate reductase A [Devosia sp.]MBN9314903.1 glyoxylate/hydroxypyruvate reductase A [Devosia sp.]
MTLLLHLADFNERRWADGFAAALPGYRVVTRADAYDPAEVDYIFIWKPKADAFDGLVSLKAILSLGAGVDAVLRHPNLPAGIPIVRFMDESLTQQMCDYILASALAHHRLVTRFARDKAAKRWSQLYPAPAWSTTVGVMGLGAIGSAAIRMLGAIGFRTRGWSRSAKQIEGVPTFAGPEGFDAFLSETDILVNVLPLTPETHGILNYETFAKLRKGGLDGYGPAVVNCGRGGHQREADLVRALTDGTLGSASLDVYESEPLPAESPLWNLDNVLFTPHIAGASTEKTGVVYFSQVIRDHMAGKPLPNIVDRARGY